MKFLGNVLATIVGLVIFSFLMILILVGIIAGSAATTKTVPIPDEAVLKIDLDHPVVERKSNDPFENLPLPGAGQGSIGLIQLKRAIEHAKNDNKIKGILLDPGFAMAGYATLEEIRDALQNFKDSGKFVVGYGEIITEKGYYLTSVCDEIYLNPEGELEFNGLASNTTFFKGTLEKLGIEPQIFRVGEYKSAIEPLIREDMSEASRNQTSAYLNSIYNTHIQRISEGRNIPENELRSIADSMLVRSADDAKELGFIDEAYYYDQVLDTLRGHLGHEKDSKIEFVGLNKYLQSFSGSGTYNENKIAVIVAEGNIVSGQGGQNAIGSAKFAKELRDARQNENVKAVVLRINSPGGSALASDVMWREVMLTQKSKPVIASMSDLAASGGYYMAMAADTIVAHSNTITGSIGIFGVIFNTKEFLNDKLGITTDVVKTGEFSDIFNLSRPLNEAEKRIIQNYVEQGYDTFVSKAAQGRDISEEALREVAQGRVWTGEDAKKHKLVDVLGGLDKAIKIAAQKAKLGEEYQVSYYPKKKSIFEQIMSELNGGIQQKILQYQLGNTYPYFEKIKEIKQWKGIQARLPYDINIE